MVVLHYMGLAYSPTGGIGDKRVWNLAGLKQVLEGLTWLAGLEMVDLDRLTIII